MKKPAARLGDMTAHGTPLTPGLGSQNVFIGKIPAWRGVSPAQAAQLTNTFNQGMNAIAQSQIEALAVKGTPASPAAEAKVATTIITTVQMMTQLISSFTADKHLCPLLYGVVPHGSGVVIDGSSTVFINNLAACRVGDTIQETLSVNKIAAGCPTVTIA
ncbi:PAAR domain-containing protein [Desertifilum sp. FACHB-1129]|uniref:Uncharacterized protein n=2 Tax=Desertifilum tharense IPPAS B-1220 TaxID=1781255 RepID=A0A1E5QLE8_9CYAN|nr:MULTISPECIES: PAAR domain-containing protein [Desertifilum]MDA0212088.1 PAAR domain-containing protein [Cyanobacteria bacterium FC1]MBD2314108.1 PAAR domain-containing protein [Desertifilum sp. FACHB-1129]MBD2323593.1 PAAR domain-containing protein [Desertifilum sp. FACHB-866]MBD2335045.1 PAAR domain-containing protein [Desertifilum sp. FACHB-868]OEJ75397.1 hypothetical protein BH720_09770 [Desertifilum tharense IPPAS B-1220]